MAIAPLNDDELSQIRREYQFHTGVTLNRLFATIDFDRARLLALKSEIDSARRELPSSIAWPGRALGPCIRVMATELEQLREAWFALNEARGDAEKKVEELREWQEVKKEWIDTATKTLEALLHRVQAADALASAVKSQPFDPLLSAALSEYEKTGRAP